MASGPERPDAAKGDQRSPDAMDLVLGIRVARFPGEHARRMDASLQTRYVEAADVEEIAEIVEIVPLCYRRRIRTPTKKATAKA
jgi:hypothetical protein